jgi:hypothetical protein
MLNRARSMFVIAALIGAFSLLPAAGASAQQGGGGGLMVPITGVISGTDVPLVGQFNIQRFQANQAGEIEAVGTAVFQFVEQTDLGPIVRTIVRQLVLRTILDILDPGPGPCPILLLEIPGGVNLDILGLVIDLAPVRLEITAEPGPGNLLGNLLCAITGLLDQGGPLQQLVSRLNNLLRLLG